MDTGSGGASLTGGVRFFLGTLLDVTERPFLGFGFQDKLGELTKY